jgi:multiple sugar transport system permease protein
MEDIMTSKLSAGAKREITGWMFLLPMFVCFLVFVLYPIIEAFRMSLYGFNYMKYFFAGFDNYVSIFQDRVFLLALWNTFKFVFFIVPGVTVVSVGLSLLIVRWPSGWQGFFKSAFFIPGVTSVVSLTMVWRYIFNEQFGIANYLMRALGMEGVNWLGAGIAYGSITLITISMFIGSNIVVLTAGLNGIPNELYESADLDGARPWTRLLSITLPLLRPTLLYVVVAATIGAFQVFAVIMLMTGGGPAFDTTTILMIVYREAFSNMNFGVATAMGFVLALIVSTIAVIQFKFLSTDVEY